MNHIELGNFLQNLVDEDIIDNTETERHNDAFGKYNLLRLNFKKKMRICVIDNDGNMTPFECDCIEYSSRRSIEFLVDNSLYLSKIIDDVANIIL